MPDGLHRKRIGSNGLLLSASVHRRIPWDQQKPASEHGNGGFCYLLIYVNKAETQAHFDGFTEEEVCAALLNVCPADSETLQKRHQDSRSKQMNQMMETMLPGGNLQPNTSQICPVC